ncbi:hypothetical protein DPMN_031840 [Dreissena polymorpha]|uniref:Uncharacterized protein n=1 Tax=Dreissena polymorpha TaxID=45954 RepID=A0A9D4M1S2_DREPO|nr:hypothetical protein DPMN_031840 [Dreissena polymorpha]
MAAPTAPCLPLNTAIQRTCPLAGPSCTSTTKGRKGTFPALPLNTTLNLPTSQHPSYTEDLSTDWHFLYKYYNGTIRHVSSPSY